jgi:hypothetical protein
MHDNERHIAVSARVDISEGALPFREKVSPNTLFAPLLTL